MSKQILINLLDLNNNGFEGFNEITTICDLGIFGFYLHHKDFPNVEFNLYVFCLLAAKNKKRDVRHASKFLFTLVGDFEENKNPSSEDYKKFPYINTKNKRGDDFFHRAWCVDFLHEGNEIIENLIKEDGWEQNSD